MWRKRSNSQFQMANHRDGSIMGYSDVIVCVTVINLTNAFFFIGLDRSRLTNLDQSDFWLWMLWMQPLFSDWYNSWCYWWKTLRDCCRRCLADCVGQLRDCYHSSELIIFVHLFVSYYTVSQRTSQLWNGIAQNYKDWLWWHLAEVFKIL